MLDENLPTFYLRSANDGVSHHASVLLSQHGSDALPEYSLRHPDPTIPGSKNRYSVALCDSYNPEIIFGEVLLIPEYGPGPSKEEIRLNGGMPPPPQPILPTRFTVQLYNPDQQVTIEWHTGTWNSSPYWSFEMPQQSFRQPSTSSLDRTKSDPTASDLTPKLGFKWKKDGHLSKDYVCSLSEKSTNPDGSKRKHREPDITIAMFRHFKEITVYEPNLSRIEMEDFKGFEVVLLLGAVVIREVYNSNMREAFNIGDLSSSRISDPAATSSHASHALPERSHPASLSNGPAVASGPPPTDPRTQWELDAEAARLRQQVAAENRARKRADAAETKRVQRMVEEEARLARDRQKEVDRETERLKKIYGKEQRQSQQQLRQGNDGDRRRRGSLQPIPQSQAVTNYPPAPIVRPHSAAPMLGQPAYVASNLRPPQQQGGQYLAPVMNYGPAVGSAQLGTFTSASSPGQQPAPKKSFWRLKGGGEDSGRLQKQRSTVF